MSIGACIFATFLYLTCGGLDIFMAVTSYKEEKYFAAGMWFTSWAGLMICLAKIILEY